MKIDRLLSIILILINRPMVTARELSEKYEVTIRTIYRDIEAISSAGIPVVSYQGKKGGFCLMENYRIDRQLLTIDDMVSILLSMKGINKSLNNSGIENTIEKIECLVPHDKRTLVQQRFEDIIIDISPHGNIEAHRSKLKSVNEAISSKCLLSFIYRNLKGEEAERLIEPMSLVLKTNIWYVFGYCLIKNDYRVFRISRMHGCKNTGKEFIRRNKTFNEAEFFNYEKLPSTLIQLKFAPSARLKVDEFFQENIKVVTVQGYIIVEIKYPEDEWLYSFILGFGYEVEVLSPSHIRAEIADRLEKANKIYKS